MRNRSGERIAKSAVYNSNYIKEGQSYTKIVHSNPASNTHLFLGKRHNGLRWFEDRDTFNIVEKKW
jgi:hypothetical protein